MVEIADRPWLEDIEDAKKGEPDGAIDKRHLVAGHGDTHPRELIDDYMAGVLTLIPVKIHAKDSEKHKKDGKGQPLSNIVAKLKTKSV